MTVERLIERFEKGYSVEFNQENNEDRLKVLQATKTLQKQGYHFDTDYFRSGVVRFSVASINGVIKPKV